MSQRPSLGIFIYSQTSFAKYYSQTPAFHTSWYIRHILTKYDYISTQVQRQPYPFCEPPVQRAVQQSPIMESRKRHQRHQTNKWAKRRRRENFRCQGCLSKECNSKNNCGELLLISIFQSAIQIRKQQYHPPQVSNVSINHHQHFKNFIIQMQLTK